MFWMWSGMWQAWQILVFLDHFTSWFSKSPRIWFLHATLLVGPFVPTAFGPFLWTTSTVGRNRFSVLWVAWSSKWFKDKVGLVRSEYYNVCVLHLLLFSLTFGPYLVYLLQRFPLNNNKSKIAIVETAICKLWS